MPRTHKQRDREGFAASCACSLLCFKTPQTFNPLQTTCLRHASRLHISHIWKYPPEHLSHQPLFPSTKISLRPSQHLHHAPSSFQNFEELTMDTRCSWDTVLHGAPYNMYTAFFVENPKHGCTCQPCYHDVCRDLHHGKQFEDNTRLYTRGLATLWRVSRSSRSITTWSLHALQSVMTKRQRTLLEFAARVSAGSCTPKGSLDLSLAPTTGDRMSDKLQRNRQTPARYTSCGW